MWFEWSLEWVASASRLWEYLVAESSKFLDHTHKIALLWNCILVCWVTAALANGDCSLNCWWCLGKNDIRSMRYGGHWDRKIWYISLAVLMMMRYLNNVAVMVKVWCVCCDQGWQIGQNWVAVIEFMDNKSESFVLLISEAASFAILILMTRSCHVFLRSCDIMTVMFHFQDWTPFLCNYSTAWASLASWKVITKKVEGLGSQFFSTICL